jgi:carboxyl-terminal processing protease
MFRLLLILPLLLAACSRNKADPEEIASIFARHSYAAADPASVKRAVASGKPALLRAVDPYAVILPPGTRLISDYPDYLIKASAGVMLWRAAAGLEIVNVFPGSPAAAAGLEAGDTLSGLDGKDCAAMRPENVNLALYGESGGTVAFKAVKKNGAALSGQLKRAQSSFPTVWGVMLPGERAGYLRISYFAASSAEAVKKKLEAFTAAEVRGVVIDLRHNDGGSLDALADTLALFAPGGKPVFKAVSLRPGYVKEFAAPKAGPFRGMKLAILTDSGTASRAEIFAAVLREWGGAFTAGGATAGNVSVTKNFKLKNGGALRLAVARLVTPAGTDLDGKGLAPDLAVDDPLEGDLAFAADYPPPLASADPVLQAALKKLK